MSGELIDQRFLLHEPIGVGGMGSAVWRAEQTDTGRDVALKILKPASYDAADRFRRGAIISSHLNHPNITTTHAIGQHFDGSLYLVMEHLDGEGMAAAMRGGPMSASRVIVFADQLLSALSHMSAQGVAHLDIKPDNLFLVGSDDVRLKVLDFDIADVVTPAKSVRLASMLPPRRAETICGTPQYMAPEVLRGAQADCRADLYAAGVLMFQLLCGRLPFAATEPFALVREHHLGQPRLALLRNAGARLVQVIQRALQIDPNQRFSDATAMRRALREAQDGGALVPMTPRRVDLAPRPEESLGGNTTMPCRPAPAQLRGQQGARPSRAPRRAPHV